MTDTGARRVTLHGGMWDGGESYASHWAAKVGGQMYVWDGGEDKDRFVWVSELLGKMPVVLREAEHATVQEWAMAPTVEPMPGWIPMWRVMAWVEVVRYNIPV